MKLTAIRAFDGVNFYTPYPAVVATLDYECDDYDNSADIAGFNDRLLLSVPSLGEHECSSGPSYEHFVDRIAGGLHINHVLVHVAQALFRQLEPFLSQRFTCQLPRTKTERVVLETRSAEVMSFLLTGSLDLIHNLINDAPTELEGILTAARQILNRTELGPSGRCIVDAAENRDIPWSRENDHSLVQLGYGRNLHFVQAAATDNSSDIAVDIVGNKNETKNRLNKFSIPTPAGFVVRDEDEALRALKRLDSAVVIKPLNGNQGRGVSLNLKTPDEVRSAFIHAQKYSSRVLVEELLTGKNYRVLIVGGKMAAASERRACSVTGDGRHSLQELVEIENQNPLRGEGHEKPLTRIKLTENIIANLSKGGWALSDIPENGKIIEICNGMNLSTGGSARDVTDDVHRSVQLLCERAARVVNLDICGIDLMLEDISLPMPQGKGGIIEINAAPGLRMHLYPSEGKPRDVGSAVIEMLYPNGAPGRIPIIAITGTNGKTTVTRMIAHILLQTGMNIGATTTDGIMLNGENIVFGDTTGPASAKTILGDKLVDIAVLETARGGMLRRGLGWDWADVGVVTNITEDHIGQDGIESVKDLVEIKALIAERVREGGTVVLNADDEESANLVNRPAVLNLERKIVFFSTRTANPIVEKHVRKGGTAYILQDNTICEATGDDITEIVNSLEVPITINGTAEYQIQNVMAATAAARAMGMQPDAIAAALKAFEAGRQNQGRTNIYRLGKGLVVIDYGHNPKAIEAICKMISQWGMKSTCIISFPGDRRDDVIVASSKQTARGFDRIIIKGDKNLRGRREGEVARIMLQTIAENGGPEDTTIELDAHAAFEREIVSMAEKEVVVFFYEKLKPVRDILQKFGAVQVENINIDPSVDDAFNALRSGKAS
jgi:cyanophycin synthetase